MTIPFDKWSIVHAGSGFALGALGVPRLVAYLLIAVWEAIELFAVWMGSEFFQESAGDVVLDLVIGVTTYELGRLAR